LLITYRLAAMAFNAAFLFFDDADFTSFNAADLTRLVRVDVPFLARFRLTVVGFSAVCLAVVLRFTVRFVVDVLRVFIGFPFV
jgi:hypothetical protein